MSWNRINWTVVATLLLAGGLLVANGNHQVTGAKDSPTVRGVVKFDGPQPKPRSIRMTEKGGKPSGCRKLYKGALLDRNRVVSKKGELANVFVYVKEGLEGLQFPTPGPALLDQDGCVYLPHVLGVMAGQDITIRNSDGLLHNINASPTVNRGFNSSQPVSMETTRAFSASEVMVPLRCDAHGWMNAYVGVLDHPFHSVSNGSGAFSLSTLPPGEYVIEAWHERYGTQTQTVTVTTGQTADVTFTFTAS